mmetsp:Transcript_10207/g.23645  ORF Transcript_10207/g.23645 Transcript_10207/m.23645 type:complete len:480 (-) Transcript_10207:2364-3803(-)
MQSIKQILKQVLIVVAGIFVSLLLLVWISLLLLQPSKPEIRDKAILHIALRGKVVERTSNTFVHFSEQEKIIDLLKLKAAIKHAKKDNNVKGIYLEADVLNVGWASLEEIRDALLSFQETGKFIVSYGARYTQKTYYLASVADDIVLHPESVFPLKGLSQTFFFYKGLLDQLAVAPQIFRVGSYKSTVEPFTRQNMSKESKHQSSNLLAAVYNHFLDRVAMARGLKKDTVQTMATTLSTVIPKDACQANLVSQVGYFDEAETLIKTKLGIAQDSPINYVSFDAYASCKESSQISEKQIAVLIAEGNIVDNTSMPGAMASKDLVASLRTIRKDKSIKAVVLRINSPGGSALAADILWKELMLTKAKKPVVASMSDIAASGGYYLAVACNRIFAHPTTITGSIGIFGLFFDIHTLLNNKLGITTDTVKIGNSADLFENIGRPFSSHEKALIQKIIDKGYDTFLDRIVTGRKIDKKSNSTRS